MTKTVEGLVWNENKPEVTPEETIKRESYLQFICENLDIYQDDEILELSDKLTQELTFQSQISQESETSGALS